MEALAAIGLASNLLQFIELGFKLAKKARGIHQSSSGSTEEDTSHLRSGDLRYCFRMCRRGSPIKPATGEDSSKGPTLQGQSVQGYNQEHLEEQGEARSGHPAGSRPKWTQYSIATSDEGTQLQSISTQISSLREDLSRNCHNTAIVTELYEVLEKPRQSLIKMRQHQILESLRFDSMRDREEGISEAHEATYDWILAPEGSFATSAHESTSRRFQSWLQQNGGIFFIMGKPGAGKSVLMKTISGHENFHRLLATPSNESQIVVAKFFFWNAGSNHQKSFQGLIRSLLHSILSQAPDLIPAAFPKEWEETKQFSGQSWTAHHDHKKINAVFEELIHSELLYRDRKLAFLIDGLDELEGDHRHMVERIRSWSSTGGDNLKICVSSREWNVFTDGFSDCEGLQLQMLTHDDMFRTAKDTLAGNNDFKRLEAPTEELEAFASSLVEKAEGVFLWTSLVLRLLQDGLSDGDEMRQLQNKLDVLPTELEDLFQHMLTSISRGVKRDRNSDPAEVLASEMQGMARAEADEYLQKKISKLRKRLTGRCKCLLEIRQSENHTPCYNESVHLAHRKVKEYIEGDQPVSLLTRFTAGIKWEADHLRTLAAHIKFMVKSGHTFIGWPHPKDPYCHQDEDCEGPSTCATENFAIWFTRELSITLAVLRYNKTSTPICIIDFLKDISTLVEHFKDEGNLFKSTCSKGAFYAKCGAAHIHGYHKIRPQRLWPFLTCSHGQDAGTHISIPHIAGFAAIPEFFGTGLSDIGFAPKQTHDSAGLIRCTAFRQFKKFDDDSHPEKRRAEILDRILDQDLRIDRTPYGCSYKNPVEKGYDWTVWQVMLCQRILGHSDELYPEDWNSLFKKLLGRGIDIKFCLRVHHSLREGHLKEYPPATYPFWDLEDGGSNTYGWVDSDRPDHGPLAIFLLAEDSKLARMAKERGGVLSLADLFEWMGIRLEESQKANIKVPLIPCLDGWKLARQMALRIYEDDKNSSCGILRRMVRDTPDILVDSKDNSDNGSSMTSDDDPNNALYMAYTRWIRVP
ncbi:hypothetical protein PG997_015045 [Apiospora hydei]|uniref:NACHT domain-containing protein n=1 Tax=Apiospora hydei TaxID=1337664 RepID=A0ABR1UVJ8_9PEZI